MRVCVMCEGVSDVCVRDVCGDVLGEKGGA